MKKEFTYKEFNPYSNLVFIRLLLDRFKLNPILIGLLVYVAYYFGTLLLGCFSKVLFPPTNLEGYSIPFFQNYIKDFTNQQCTLALLADKSHFAFSTFVVLPGTIFAMFFLRKLPRYLIEFVDNDIITSPVNEINHLFEKFQKRIKLMYVHIFIIIISIIGFVIFLRFTSNPDFSYWWGSINYGWDGRYLALMIAIMLYHGLYILYIAFLFILFIRDLMTLQIKLRPFHPDTCNGYQPLGNIILILFALSVVVAIAVFIVLYLGFLELQNTMFMFGLIVGCLILTPLLILLPSYFVVSKIKSEKNKLLEIIEKRMNKITTELEKQLIDDEGIAFHDKIDELLKVNDSFGIYSKINIWPYNIRLIQTIVLTYILQIVLLIYKSIIK